MSTGVQEYRSTGVQEYRSTGVQEYRSTGVQEYRSTGVQEYRSNCGGQQKFQASNRTTNDKNSAEHMNERSPNFDPPTLEFLNPES
jgi:hypothetical protein